MMCCDRAGGEDNTVASNLAIEEGLENSTQSTACMLVYIRTSDLDWVMCETGKDDISEPIRSMLEVRDCSW